MLLFDKVWHVTTELYQISITINWICLYGNYELYFNASGRESILMSSPKNQGSRNLDITCTCLSSFYK